MRHLPAPSVSSFSRCARFVLPLLLAGAALLGPLPAAGQDMLAFLITQMDLERDLLADDLRQYGDHRESQKAAATAREEALVALDGALETGTVTLGQLEDLEAELQSATERLTVLDRQGGDMRQRIYDRLRRTALLGDRIDRLRGSERVRLDPVTGTWEMEIRPGKEVARLRLSLNGTLLNGTYYYLDGSASGSVRGIFAGDKITLERIDSRRGFDSVWEGEIDPVRRELKGTWTATDLSGGGPSSGTWDARKIDPEAERENSQESDEDEDGGESP